MSVLQTGEVVNVSPLRQARERLGLSQTQVSCKTGIHPSTISRLEAGKLYPYPGWRARLARALQVPQGELFPDARG